MPEHLCGSERHDQIVPQRAGLLEELEMPGVEDVIASGDKDFFHEFIP
jgi:hypothetical protein